MSFRGPGASYLEWNSILFRNGILLMTKRPEEFDRLMIIGRTYKLRFSSKTPQCFFGIIYLPTNLSKIPC